MSAAVESPAHGSETRTHSRRYATRVPISDAVSADTLPPEHFARIRAEYLAQQAEFDDDDDETVEYIPPPEAHFQVPEAAPELEPHPLDANISHAYKVDLDELVRQPGNQGKVLDFEYVTNQTDVREFIVDSFVDGTLYGQTGEDFTRNLIEMHELAARGNVYNRVGGGGRDKFTSDMHGEIRHDRQRKYNYRFNKAFDVADTVRRYDDPYAHRFDVGAPERVDMQLPGISPENQAVDIYKGRDVSEKDGKYMFLYPPGDAMPEYMEQINVLGNQISEKMRADVVDAQEVLELIARQYQYGAIARPFQQINNSIFMNLVNAQIKMLGYDGISHGNFDYVAQRMQPENFVKFFKEIVRVPTKAQIKAAQEAWYQAS